MLQFTEVSILARVLVTIACVPFFGGGKRRVNGEYDGPETGCFGALDQMLRDVVATVRKLEPERPGGHLGDFLHAVVGGGAAHHQGVGHPCTARSGELPFRVRVGMTLSGRNHHRKADVCSQDSGRNLALGDVPHETRPQRKRLEGRAVSSRGELVHRAGFDEFPMVVRQDLLGPCLVFVEVDWVHSHGRNS